MAALRSGTSGARVSSSRIWLVEVASSSRASTRSAWLEGFGSSSMAVLAPAGRSSPPSALTFRRRVRNEVELLVDQQHRGLEHGRRREQVVGAEARGERL